jgi:hypothetical protein
MFKPRDFVSSAQMSLNGVVAISISAANTQSSVFSIIEAKDTSPALIAKPPTVKAVSRIKSRLLIPPNKGNGSARAKRASNGLHGVPDMDMISAGYNRYGTSPLMFFDGNEMVSVKKSSVAAHFTPVFNRCIGESPRLRHSMLSMFAIALYNWDITPS